MDTTETNPVIHSTAVEAAAASLVAAPDELLDAAVEHLRQLAHVALVEFAVAAGRYIVETFFDGNFGNFFDRSKLKATSFNALCVRRADELATIGLSQSTLRRYVHAYDTWRHLPEAARADLSLRSLELLRKVPDQVARTELMLRAQREGWSARAFIDEVAVQAEALSAAPSGRGRPRLLAGEKSLRGLVRQAQAVAKDQEAIAALPAEKLEALRAELAAAMAAVDGVLAAKVS